MPRTTPTPTAIKPDNFAEYAMGTNPTIPDSPIQSFHRSETTSDTMEFEFTRRVLDGVLVFPEWSADLLDPWFATGFTEIVDPNAPEVSEGDIETLKYSFPINSLKKFMRIRVE